MKENIEKTYSAGMYSEPSLEVVRLEVSDVISTSLNWDLPEIPISDDPLAIGVGDQ